MRPMKFWVLPALFLAAAVPSIMLSKAQKTEDKTGGPQRNAPRASADSYHSHSQRDGISVGAEILTPNHIHKVFVSDLNRCCLVVEFAIYPKKEKLEDLLMDDFALFVSGNDVPTKPESATMVAASLQKGAHSGAEVAEESSATIGYESGTYTDPVTGQPRIGHGVYTATSSGVGTGKTYPVPDATEQDRQVMEKELSQKGLPEGRVAAPIAGYLYFFIPKRLKNTKYRLEYNLNGEKLVLPLS
jgi:hypothetical protein